MNPLDPARFRADGHRVIDLLADALEAWERREGPVLPWVHPEQGVVDWALPAEPEGLEQVVPILERVIATSHHLHHPRYVGHQVSAPLPQAALADLVSSLLNNGAAVYEMGPAVVAMEQALVRAMAGVVGLPAGSVGVFTSGGSAGNLTALLAARQARAGFDVWRDGLHAGPPLAILCSSQTHYSVARAAAIMGLGDQGVIRLPVDERFRLRPEAIADGVARARALGRTPFALVASAASTATGACDPLDAVATACAAHGLWLHVDGAHGASLALSSRRGLLAGIERADSVVWDAHKLLAMPALCTAVLYRDAAHGAAAFSQEASYLFGSQPPWWDLGARTLECTKLMLVLKLYLAWRTLGPRELGAHVDRLCDLAADFARLIASQPDFELAVEPDCDIVCFRLRGADSSQVRQRIVESGAFYLVETRLPAGTFLRCTIINPRTTLEDLRELLATIRATAGGAPPSP